MQVYHIIPPIDDMKYLVDITCTFQVAAILLKFLKSIMLNLEAQYLAWLCIQSGATYSQEIIYLVYIVLKL